VNALDFFVDFAVTGRVEGVSINSTPEDWSDRLGADFIDDESKSKKRMRRDYGLVELGFYRVEGAWRCLGIGIQVHRLWWNSDNVPAKLRSRYGDFPRIVPFEDLRERLSALGHEPRLIEDEQPFEYTRYYIPDTKILIGVLSPERGEDFDDMPAGMLWAMHLSDDSEIWARPREAR
jgi:hypothetical protein